MGSSFRGRRMPGEEASAAAKVRGATGRGLLGRDLRQQGVLAAAVCLVIGQAVCHFPKPDACSELRRILAYFCAFCASRSNFAEFLRFTAAGHFALDALVNVLGVTAPLSCQLLRISILFCSFLFDEQIYFPRRRNGDDRAAAHWFGGLSENNERSESV